MGRKIQGRELLEACYVRKFRFDSLVDYSNYIEVLNESKIDYDILSLHNDCGVVTAIIATSYNATPLLELKIETPE